MSYTETNARSRIGRIESAPGSSRSGDFDLQSRLEYCQALLSAICLVQDTEKVQMFPGEENLGFMEAPCKRHGFNLMSIFAALRLKRECSFGRTVGIERVYAIKRAQHINHIYA